MGKWKKNGVLFATLVFPVRNGKVLLALKKKKIGIGRLNGWGGKLEIGESFKTCAAREFFQETGGAKVNKKDLKKVGVAHFRNQNSDGSVFLAVVYVFIVEKWKGEIIETDEMGPPQEFTIPGLTRINLMPADKFWLPRMLMGETGIVWAKYAPHQKKLIGKVRFEPISFIREE